MVRLAITPDGQVRTYELDLSSHSEYRGLVASIRFNPLNTGEPGGEVDLYYISHKKLE